MFEDRARARQEEAIECVRKSEEKHASRRDSTNVFKVRALYLYV